jgi:hypothetical protein
MLKQYVAVTLICLASSLASAADLCPNTVIPALGAAQQEYLSAAKELTLLSGCGTQGSYLFYRKWYADHVPAKRSSSQALAILIVLLGASLPLLAFLETTSKSYKLWIAAIGAAIVVAQGLTQSFHLDESWRGYLVAQMRLEFAHNTWQQQIVNASLVAKQESSLQQMQDATETFGKAVSEIVLDETGGYFSASAKARAPQQK